MTRSTNGGRYHRDPVTGERRAESDPSPASRETEAAPAAPEPTIQPAPPERPKKGR